MVLLCPRIHLFEIDDQPWFPKFLRRKIQSCLALCWTLHIPIIQPSSPAQLAAITLCRTLSDDVTSYTFVDFCAGAGGPTPYIEVYVNAHLKNKSSTTTHGASYAEVAAAPKAAHGLTPRSPRPVDEDHGHGDDRDGKVQFVLTDIHPHIPDWTAASKRSPNLTFIPKSVDAANAPRDILKKVHVGSHMNGANGEKKVFRLYNLAFHHFGQELASKILKNTMETADGFAIFELQERDLSSFVTIFGMIIAITIMTPFYFWLR
ncbi:hypothetical protein DSL72_007087 [Monilinia vaccinii-corymbosi]|uniref:Uncharacterized protein n=1 Tax=Monilinia vaccinii-corymbosi TaxID=61207 RepID=A0A8A3PLW7_9HELO|nr:hypothetical protein DSL72_007087 [Monilinia vaccinii-corymbosi]